MVFKDKLVWITGASSGIGEQMAYQFARSDARLILSSRNREALQLVQANCPNPQKVAVFPLDISDPESIQRTAQEVLNQYQKVDVLVNNAGISQRSLAFDTTLDVVRKIFEVNFFGTVALTKALLPNMIDRQSGHIVVISSVVGKAGVPGRSAYGASKHALHGYFDALRSEVNRDNLKVTLICPGYVQTKISLNALKSDGSKHGQMDQTTANGLTAEAFAKKALNAIAKGKKEVYLGKKELIAIYANRFFPSIYANLINRFEVKNL